MGRRVKRNNNKNPSGSNVSKGKEISANKVAEDIAKSIKDGDKTSTESKSEDESKTVEKAIRHTNDPAWYSYSPEQVSAVARIPFSERFGDLLPLVHSQRTTGWDGANNKIVVKHNTTAIPGIASIVVRPTFGMNFKITDPLNLCATELYTEVRRANNGRKNYDPADLMIHVLAIADVYSFIMWVKKIYGLAFVYSTMNNYLGKEMLMACGVHPSDITANLANLRYWLNVFISKVEAYAVPEEVNLFKRRAFMYADIYTESETDNIKDQMYTFMPDGFFKFAIDERTGAGMLDYAPVENGLHTFEYLMQLGESLLENVTQDEDFGLMSGDIMKAYGDRLIHIDPLPEVYTVEPHYDHEVLHQIMNCTPNSWLHRVDTEALVPFAHYADPSDAQSLPDRGGNYFMSGKVYQDSNGILIHGFAVYDQNVNDPGDNLKTLFIDPALNVVLNSDLPVVSEDSVMEMTRLTFTTVPAPDGWRGTNKTNLKLKNIINFLATGSDIVVGINIYVNDINRNLNQPGCQLSKYVISNKCVYLDADTDEVIGTVGMREIKLKSQFKYLPYLLEIHQGETNLETGYLLQNMANYALISPEQLQRIHEVALLSLVHVPSAMNLINR